MKKFTTLEEDLLKESLSAQESFNNRYAEFKQKITDINWSVNKMREEYRSDLRNWGYSGSMGYINEQLDNILEHLSKYSSDGYQPIVDNTLPEPPNGGSGVN